MPVRRVMVQQDKENYTSLFLDLEAKEKERRNNEGSKNDSETEDEFTSDSDTESLLEFEGDVDELEGEDGAYCDSCLVDVECYWTCKTCDSIVFCHRCFYNKKELVDEEHHWVEQDFGNPDQKVPNLVSLSLIFIAKNVSIIDGLNRLSETLKPRLLMEIETKLPNLHVSRQNFIDLFSSKQEILTMSKFHLRSYADDSMLNSITDLCTGLSTLDIKGCDEISPSSLLNLSKLKNLQRLRSSNTLINDQAIKLIVNSCLDLKTIELSGCPFTSLSSIEELVKLPKIRKIQRDGIEVTRIAETDPWDVTFYGREEEEEEDYSDSLLLHSHHQKEEEGEGEEEEEEQLDEFMDRKYNIQNATLKAISVLVPNFASLFAESNVELEEEGLVFLCKKHPEITVLDLYGQTQISDTGFLRINEYLPAVSELLISGEKITDQSAHELIARTDLTHLLLSDFSISDAAMGVLIEKLSNSLEILDFVECLSPGVQTFASILNHCKKLHWLHFSGLKKGTKFDFVRLPMLKDHSGILTLSLIDIQMKDADLVHLKELIHLENLDLCCNPINGTGLVHLKNLRRLQQLDLWQTSVTAIALGTFLRDVSRTRNGVKEDKLEVNVKGTCINHNEKRALRSNFLNVTITSRTTTPLHILDDFEDIQ